MPGLSYRGLTMDAAALSPPRRLTVPIRNRWGDGDMAVLDFGGKDNAMRVRSLHPGVTFEEVQENTGFALERPDQIPETKAPTAEQLKLIRERLDPHNLRATLIKGNPVGDRRLAKTEAA